MWLDLSEYLDKSKVFHVLGGYFDMQLQSISLPAPEVGLSVSIASREALFIVDCYVA